MFRSRFAGYGFQGARASIRRRAFMVGATVIVSSATLMTVMAWRTENAEASSEDNLTSRKRPGPFQPLPTRQQLIDKLKASYKEKDSEYDVVVIGGGATGTGVAVDAANRGLKVALLEREDFASGTSGKSTKLVHGGVRYLEKAVWSLDYDQYKMVKEALHERKYFLEIAPHLSFALPIIVPVYKYWQAPYFWAGTKCYDLLSGSQSIGGSYFMSKAETLKNFPLLDENAIKGALVYYDGSHNDSRMNVALAITAIEQGATVLNHVDVTALKKNAEGKVIGVEAKDLNDDNQDLLHIRAKSVINATGPFCDGVRKLDEPTTADIVAPSSGVHIVLPDYFCSNKYGLIDPKTSDGRVVFFLPWQGKTIAGTTDTACKIEQNPIPTKKDIEFILSEVNKYTGNKIEVRPDDILAAWSGIRPLVRDPHAKNTESLVRNHLINVSPSGLITISGGKWTTYREMAQETVDRAIETHNLKPVHACATSTLKLHGATEYYDLLYLKLARENGLETEVAEHLAHQYGDRAFEVASLSSANADGAWPYRGRRLVESLPFVDGEVRYAVQREYAVSTVDVIARRMRLAFLNCQAALEVLPRVIDIMAEELKWSEAKKNSEWDATVKYLWSMGLEQKAWSRSEVESGAFRNWEREKVQRAFAEEAHAQLQKSPIVAAD